MKRRFFLSAILFLMAARAAQSDDLLRVLRAVPERPTLHVLGVQVLIEGDADRDARVAVRCREAGTAVWRAAMPLLRVWPEAVAIDIPEQFAGSIFDLQPATAYEIALEAVDPDGYTWQDTLQVSTRPLPRALPSEPRFVDVATADQLADALAAARPGDVIEIATGTYVGSFFLRASGSRTEPIVVRGEEGVVLDGDGCTGCDVLDVAGSYVHVEDLTLRRAARALRFSLPGATANVARRLRIEDVVHGIGKAAGQTDFYIADNYIEGRLRWPWPFEEGGRAHWDDRGVDLAGDGHVVIHNRIVGFGDPVVNKKVGSRAWDVYGNDFYACWDGTELDEAAGNVRLFRNRWTNVMSPASLQPIHGGPAYVLRNVGYNIPDEQVKLKSLGGEQMPGGVLVYHNTFVSPNLALNMQSPITQYNFRFANNIFVGPEKLLRGYTVDWTTELVGGAFDHNGYWPDGRFWFGRINGQNRLWDSFALVQAAGEEGGGVLLDRGVFASGVVGPEDARHEYGPVSVTLAAGARALDVGATIPGINGGHGGAGPDLGALEHGCEEPHYGPRQSEERVWPVDCEADDRTTRITEPNRGLIERPRLHPNIPNPFNADTVLRYELPSAAQVQLDVYAVSGQRIGRLVAGRRSAGQHRVGFAAADLASGVYFYRLTAAQTRQTRAMLLVR